MTAVVVDHANHLLVCQYLTRRRLQDPEEAEVEALVIASNLSDKL